MTKIRYGIFYNGIRFRTKTGFEWATPEFAWTAVRLARPDWKFFSLEQLKEVGLAVKRIKKPVAEHKCDPLWYCSTSLGARILIAVSEESARVKARREVGTAGTVGEVRKATDEDIAWVKAMCGSIG